MRITLLAAGSLALLASTLHAQANTRPAPAPFVAEDALDIVTIGTPEISDDGRFIVVTPSVRRDAYGQDYRHDGDPTYLRVTPVRVTIIDTKTGASTDVFKDKKPVRSVKWSPDGKRLAMLIYNGDVLEPAIWDRTLNKVTTLHAGAGKYVAETSDIRFTDDGKAVVVSAHTDAWRKKARDIFANMTSGPVFVQNSKDPFLAWDDIRRQGNMRSVMTIDIATGKAAERIPESMVANYNLSPDASFLTYSADISKKTDYESFNSETALRMRDSAGAERVLRATTKGMQIVWAEDGRHYAYSNNGRVYLATTNDSSSRMIAGAPETKRGETPDTSKAARDKAAMERFTVLRYAPNADALLLSNKEGIWLADAASGAKEKLIAASDSDETLPRVTTQAWSKDGQRIYFTSASRQKWERGILLYERATKQMTTLVRDGRSYGNVRLAKDGNTLAFTASDGNRPADLYVSDARFTNPHRVMESNPQLAARQIGNTELVGYLDADGKPRKAVVYYPANFDKSRSYPTVFEVYEDFFDDNFDVRANVLTGHGYVVVHPSVGFDIGYPGEAWVKGVTAAANKLIETGVADSAKLAVQGQSYGGYATNLLITQTNRFKAAVNISGKVDMISFYTDSPRLGVRNVNAAEKTQDRLGATLWAQPQKYVAHSAIMFADRITTPLMLVTGALDSNVPADNTREMYYALRRLGKEVIWVNYANGGHGGGTASAEDFLDMQHRVLEFYDSKLMNAKAKVTTNE